VACTVYMAPVCSGLILFPSQGSISRPFVEVPRTLIRIKVLKCQSNVAKLVDLVMLWSQIQGM